MQIQYFMTIFNESCLLAAAVLLFWVNESMKNDDDLSGIVYIFLVIINYIVNIIRAYLDLFGCCGRANKYRVRDATPVEVLSNNTMTDSGLVATHGPDDLSRNNSMGPQTMKGELPLKVRLNAINKINRNLSLRP